MSVNETAQKQLRRAYKLFAQKQYDETLKIFIKIAPIFLLNKEWKKYVDLLIDISLIHYTLYNLKDAKNSIHEAIEISQTQFEGLEILTSKAYHMLAFIKWQENKFKEAILNHQKSLIIKQQLLGKSHENCIIEHSQIGACYGKIGLHNEALESLLQSQAICQKKYTEKHKENAMIYNEIGWNYLQKGNYEKALEYYRKTLEIRIELLGRNHLKTLNTFNSIGTTYNKKGDLNQALFYYKESLSIAQYLVEQPIAYHENYWDFANAFHNIGFCYFRQNKLEEALQCYQKALKQWQEVCKEDDPILAKSYDKHALCFEKQGDTTKALEYYERGLQIRLKVFGEQHSDTARSYASIGALKPLDAQLAYFEKSLKIRQQIFGEKHPDIATNFGQIGQYFVAKKQWVKALSSLQKGIISLYREEENPSTSMNVYDFPSFNNCSNPRVFLNLLAAKSQCFQALYKESKEVKDLEAANKHIIAACELIDYIRLGYKAEGSKLFLSQSTRKVYEQAINTLLESIDLKSNENIEENLGFTTKEVFQELFGVAEKSRAAVLLSNMKEFDAKVAADIPSELLEKEQELQVELSYLDQKIHQAKNKDIDETTIQSWQSEHFQYKQQYDALIEQFETDFPAYHQLKYSTDTIEVEALQQSLSPKSAVIEYFVGEDCVYIFLVTKEILEVMKVKATKTLEKTVRQFVRAINSGSQNRFKRTSLQLYQWLLEPMEAFLKKEGIEHLIFIPDDCLFMLCFDALWMSKKEKYLIEEYQISHHYSANLWYLLRQKRQKSTIRQVDSFLGFAPVFFGENSREKSVELKSTDGYMLDTDLDLERKVVLKSGTGEMAALKESEIEVRKVFQLFEDKNLTAKAFFYESASKKNLLQQIEGYKYVLISTHGFVDKEVASLSGLMLAKEQEIGEQISNNAPKMEEADKLFLSETYHLSLSADLVVLSSCESGIGEVLKGEGMVALNRGFLHAGASNVLYSLIKVPQDATSELIQSFFRYILEESKSYTEALQLSKRQLIDAEYELRDWAGFALLAC